MFNIGGNPYFDACSDVQSNARNHVYYRDPATAPSTAQLRLTGTVSNIDGIGARITVFGDQTYHDTMDSTQGFQSTNSTHPLIVLGEGVRQARVEIAWPSGTVQTLEVSAGDALEVIEPGGTWIKRKQAPRPAAAKAVHDRYAEIDGQQGPGVPDCESRQELCH